ncbi:MAG: hypothetical protein R3F61_29805 [Myxococcota bacterium]
MKAPLSLATSASVLFAVLGCSGVATPPAPPRPAPAPEPVAPAPDVAPEVAPVEDVGSVVSIQVENPSWPASPRVFSLEDQSGTCVWKVSGVDGRSVAFAKTSGCPEQVVWSSQKLVAWFGDHTLVHTWKADHTERLPTESGAASCQAPVPAKNGELRRVCLQYTDDWTLDGQRFPVGETEDGSMGYGLKGRTVVAPRNDGKDVFLPGIGSKAFAIVEFYGPSGWERAFAFPTMTDSEFGPGADVVEPFLGSDAAVSTEDLQECCACGQDCAFDDDAARATKLGFTDAESVGSLEVGSGRAWFPVLFGDTPHASSPVVWCATPDCTAPVAWESVEGQLTVAPRGKHVLVGSEYSGAGARVYEAGKPTPVLAFPDATTAVWLPDGALPPL